MVNLTVHRKVSPIYANNISENEQVGGILEVDDERWSILSPQLHQVADLVSPNDFGKSTILGRNSNFMRPFDEAMITYDSLYRESSWQSDSPVGDDNPNPFIQREDDILLDPSFSEKIFIPSGNKIIVIGDLHSGLQSLVQILDDLVHRGILSDTLELKSGYFIVFLGDLVDRGALGLDILHIVFRMKVQNFQNVYIINGNHEDVSLYNRGSFGEEISTQIVKPDDIFKIQSLLTYLPSVIFAHMSESGEWIQMNHGGIEPAYNPRGFIESDNDYDFHGFDFDGDLFFMGLRWNDFSGDFLAGIGTSSRGEGVFEYGKLATESYLRNNNLSGIVRGHQELTHFMALQRTDGSQRELIDFKIGMSVIPEDHWKSKNMETQWEKIPLVNVFDDFSVLTSSSANRARKLNMNVYLEITNPKTDFVNAQEEITNKFSEFLRFAGELDIIELFEFIINARFGEVIYVDENKFREWKDVISHLKEEQEEAGFEFYNWFILDEYNFIQLEK